MIRRREGRAAAPECARLRIGAPATGPDWPSVETHSAPTVPPWATEMPPFTGQLLRQTRRWFEREQAQAMRVGSQSLGAHASLLRPNH
jgi:hypothetical protein